jgi:ribosomal protein L40E
LLSAIALIAAGVYLAVFQNNSMNELFGMQTCNYPSNYNPPPSQGPGPPCSPPGYITYWNPIGGVLVFEALLIISFLWLRQTRTGKIHPVAVSYAGLAFLSWFIALILVVGFRLGSLSGSEQYKFLTGYLPASIAFFWGGTGVSYLFFSTAKKHATITEMKIALWLWVATASFVFLQVLGVFGLQYGQQLLPLSISTVAYAIVFASSISPSLYILAVRKHEFKKMQDALNVAPMNFFCIRCGTKLGTNVDYCWKCGTRQLDTRIRATTKRYSYLYGLITLPVLLIPLLSGVMHIPSSFVTDAFLIVWLASIFPVFFQLRVRTIHIVVNGKTIEDVRIGHTLPYVDDKGREKIVHFEKADRIRSKPVIMLKVSPYSRYELTFYSQQELDSAASLFFAPRFMETVP